MENLINDTKLSRTGQTARLLRISSVWLRDEARAGRVPCIKCGKDFIFNPASVEQSILERVKTGNALLLTEWAIFYAIQCILSAAPCNVTLISASKTSFLVRPPGVKISKRVAGANVPGLPAGINLRVSVRRSNKPPSIRQNGRCFAVSVNRATNDVIEEIILKNISFVSYEK